jgi:hypothetical protein
MVPANGGQQDEGLERDHHQQPSWPSGPLTADHAA